MSFIYRLYRNSKSHSKTRVQGYFVLFVLALIKVACLSFISCVSASVSESVLCQFCVSFSAGKTVGSRLETAAGHHLELGNFEALIAKVLDDHASDKNNEYWVID